MTPGIAPPAGVGPRAVVWCGLAGTGLAGPGQAGVGACAAKIETCASSGSMTP
jgi:hypothetical protein